MTKLQHRIANYFLRHLQVMLYSLGQLWRQPVSSLMTLLVIGIALALPAGLYVLLHNIDEVSAQWHDSAQISLFLQQHLADETIQQLAQQLRSWPEIASTHTQSAEQSLEEFRQLSGLGSLLDNLPRNPLPAVITVYPEPHLTTEDIATLLSRLNALPEVDQAQLDMEWLQRLHSLTALAQRGIMLLTLLLSLSVLLIIGNTIRLAILSRQSEIRVIKLVGGTDRFIRRPFLYTGFWYGSLGGLVAWLILQSSLAFIHQPIDELAQLYHSHYHLLWLSGPLFLLLPLSGVMLGVLGAWLTVNRHLSDIEPQ